MQKMVLVGSIEGSCSTYWVIVFGATPLAVTKEASQQFARIKVEFPESGMLLLSAAKL